MKERKFKVGDNVVLKGIIMNICDGDDGDFLSIMTKNYRMGVHESDLEKMIDNSDKTYEQGLEDGCRLIKKILDMDLGVRNNLFGMNDFVGIYSNFTVAQVKEKIEKYEKRTNIEIGDIVKIKSLGNKIRIGVVTQLHNNMLTVLDRDGFAELTTMNNVIEKMDCSIDISKVLEGIGEYENIGG